MLVSGAGEVGLVALSGPIHPPRIDLLNRPFPLCIYQYGIWGQLINTSLSLLVLLANSVGVLVECVLYFLLIRQILILDFECARSPAARESTLQTTLVPVAAFRFAVLIPPFLIRSLQILRN